MPLYYTNSTCIYVTEPAVFMGKYFCQKIWNEIWTEVQNHKNHFNTNYTYQFSVYWVFIVIFLLICILMPEFFHEYSWGLFPKPYLLTQVPDNKTVGSIKSGHLLVRLKFNMSCCNLQQLWIKAGICYEYTKIWNLYKLHWLIYQIFINSYVWSCKAMD